MKQEERLWQNLQHFTKQVNKIALSSNGDNRLQTFDRITWYSYGASAGKVCKTGLLKYLNVKWWCY